MISYEVNSQKYQKTAYLDDTFRLKDHGSAALYYSESFPEQALLADGSEQETVKKRIIRRIVTIIAMPFAIIAVSVVSGLVSNLLVLLVEYLADVFYF